MAIRAIRRKRDFCARVVGVLEELAELELVGEV
jgi:hypothetical protein